MNVVEIQRALKLRGYDPGPIDGAWGRTTIKAVKAFQAANKLEQDGIVGEETIAALNAATARAAPALIKPALLAGTPTPPWYSEARRKMGLHEVKNHSALMAFLRSDGKTLGDPAKLPWCGDFVETCIALTLPAEPMVTNPYYAQNWLGFGRPAKAALGAVLVFKRPGGGHVGFYAGERADAYRVLGGNQSNQVSETWVAKARCVGIRWPHTYPFPSTGPVLLSNAGGPLSTNEA